LRALASPTPKPSASHPGTGGGEDWGIKNAVAWKEAATTQASAEVIPPHAGTPEIARAIAVRAPPAPHAAIAGVVPVGHGAALNGFEGLLNHGGIDSRHAHELDRLLVIGSRGIHLAEELLDVFVHGCRAGYDEAVGIVVVGHGQGDAAGVAVRV